MKRGACGQGRTYLSHSGGRGSPFDPLRGTPASARLDAVRVKAGKPAGSISCGEMPSTRKNGPSAKKTSPVVRRKALRDLSFCRRSGKCRSRPRHPMRLVAHRLPSGRGENRSPLGRSGAARSLHCVSPDTTPGNIPDATHQFIDRNNGERLLTPL